MLNEQKFAAQGAGHKVLAGGGVLVPGTRDELACLTLHVSFFLKVPVVIPPASHVFPSSSPRLCSSQGRTEPSGLNQHMLWVVQRLAKEIFPEVLSQE